MKIIVYIESLKTFTSGMPHRGMLKELIQIRKHDYFILVLRKGIVPYFLKDFFNELKNQKNWELHTENRTSRISNLLALFRKKNHCSINVNGNIYLNVDAQYLGKKNHPQIITVHDLSSVKKGGVSSIPYFKRFARKFTIQNGIHHADKIVSISEFTKNDIISNFKKNSFIDVIYNGIDSHWHQSKKNTFNIGNNYWIWWGGFSKRKNLKNLLFAFKFLLQESEKRNIPNIKLIGNKNKYFHKLEKIVNDSPLLVKKVTFIQQKELGELINEVANSKGLLFPSFYEGFGLPVVEALSQGIPVMTSNISALPEVAGGYATLINPNNIIEIKKGLISMLKTSNSQNEKEFKEWTNKFTYENAAKNYSEIIDKTISKYE